MEYTDTEPLREFARRRGFSPTTVYAWSNKGLIKTFLMGGRRHVVLSSYGELVKRLITEQGDAKLGSPNPRLRRERNDARQPHCEIAAQSQVSERGDPGRKPVSVRPRAPQTAPEPRRRAVRQGLALAAAEVAAKPPRRGRPRAPR